MRGIRVENGRIVYFGNPAGYIAGSQAVVDPIFKGKELEAYLERQAGLKRGMEGRRIRPADEWTGGDSGL